MSDGSNATSNATIYSRFMQNVGVSDDELRSLVSFVLFNIFVGLLGYNIWNLFPRGPPNERVQRISKRMTNGCSNDLLSSPDVSSPLVH
ncbi:hypothetical protein Q1695_013090 [Nippostrongylus brasiliensis]|nr:hypothetical protein Q1695_013090 [Nippostrongylus brasiliensis]